MQASRLVEYSDSDEEENDSNEWREFLRQRSLLRMPRATAASSTEKKTEKNGTQDPPNDRDFAFTPRKRTGYVRPAASSSSFPYSTNGYDSPLSPQVDFSFSPTASTTTEPNEPMASPMSDATPNPFGVWSSQHIHKTATTAAIQAATASFTFGSAADAVPSLFPGASFFHDDTKTPPRRQKDIHRAAKRRVSAGSGRGGLAGFGVSPGSSSTMSTPPPASSPVPSPFAFPFSTPEPPSSADRNGSYRSFDTPPVGKKKPLSPMDIEMDERTAMGTSTTSAFNVAPIPPSVSSTSTTAAFVFGQREKADEAKPVRLGRTSFAAGASGAERRSSAGGSSVAFTNTQVPFSGATPAPNGTGGHESEEKATSSGAPFFFGTSQFSTTSQRTKASKTRAFVFGSSKASVPDNKTSGGVAADAPAASSSSTSTPFAAPFLPQRKSSSFTFDAAFQDLDASSNGSVRFGSATPESRSHPPQGESTSDVDPTSGESIFSANGGRESLAVRLARRRRARENHANGASPYVASSSTTTQHIPIPRPMATPKSLFQTTENAGATTNLPAWPMDESAKPSPSQHTASFSFGQAEKDATNAKVTTNAFQKAAKRASVSARTAKAWTFAPKARFTSSTESMRQPSDTFSFTTQSEPDHGPSSPPVDHLETNFDVFNIGITEKKKSQKSTKSKINHASTSRHNDHGGPAQSTESNKNDLKSNLRSPFGVSSSPVSGTRSSSSSFVGTPPADPFVMPLFGQKRNQQDDPPKAKQRLNQRFSNDPSMFNSNPFVSAQQTTRVPAHDHNKSATRPKKDMGTGVGQANKTKTVIGVGSTAAAAAAAFIPGRRILRAVVSTKQRKSMGANGDTKNGGDVHADTEDEDEGDEGESYRSWTEWKALGGSSYSKRDYQEAADCYLNSIIELEAVLSDEPELKTDQVMKDKAKLHSNRAAALMMLLQMADAQRECFMSIECDAAYTRAYLRLGRIQIMLGDVAGAKESITTTKQLLAIEEQPGRRQDANDAAGVQKIELAVEKLVTLQAEIKWCLDVHDYTHALAHLQEALAVAPSCRALQTQKAQVLFEQKNYTQVIEYCVGVIRKQKVIQVIQKNERTESVSGASQRHRDAQAKDDNDVAMLGVELALLRIRSLHCLNKVDDAMLHMHKLEVAAPSSVKVIQLKRLLVDMKEFKHQANELFKRGEYTNAQQMYSQALQLDPSHDEYCAVLFCNRAAALMGLQQYERALQDCKSALRRKVRYPRCLLRRARCNVALSRFAAAIADFDRYLKEHPSEGGVTEIEAEKQRAKQAMEDEAHARQRKEQQKKEQRQRGSSHGKAKSNHQHNNTRQHNRNAWDDSKFYEEFWRSASSSNGAGAGGGGARAGGGARNGNGVATTPPSRRKTHYEVLGIAKAATQDEVKKAYRKLALVHHPDKAKDTDNAELFKDMTAAYSVLSDTSLRAKYDREVQFGGYGWYYEC